MKHGKSDEWVRQYLTRLQALLPGHPEASDDEAACEVWRAARGDLPPEEAAQAVADDLLLMAGPLQRRLKITVPDPTPERLAIAERAALDFFRAVGTTPYLAAHAHWRCEGLVEFDCVEFGGDEDEAAARAWDDVEHVVSEALRVDWCSVELIGVSEQSAGAPELGQSSVGGDRVALVEDLGQLGLEQGSGAPF